MFGMKGSTEFGAPLFCGFASETAGKLLADGAAETPEEREAMFLAGQILFSFGGSGRPDFSFPACRPDVLRRIPDICRVLGNAGGRYPAAADGVLLLSALSEPGKVPCCPAQEEPQSPALLSPYQEPLPICGFCGGKEKRTCIRAGIRTVIHTPENVY